MDEHVKRRVCHDALIFRGAITLNGHSVGVRLRLMTKSRSDAAELHAWLNLGNKLGNLTARLPMQNRNRGHAPANHQNSERCNSNPNSRECPHECEAASFNESAQRQRVAGPQNDYSATPLSAGAA
jgi:hypothetical protein